MLYNLIIVYLSFYIIKSEVWYAEVNGNDTNDINYGCAGSDNVFISDFYLCSDRKYRVHYKNGNWSKEFCCCQPVGIGSSLDAITISGGKAYGVSISNGNNSKWEDLSKGYGISEKDYSGRIDNNEYKMDKIVIYGGEYYRTGYGSTSSNEKDVARRFVNNFLNKSEASEENRNQNYETETLIYNDKKNINITLILLEPSKIRYNGKLLTKIEDSEVTASFYEGLIGENFRNLIKKKIGFDIYYFKSNFEKKLARFLYNINVAINFYWSENRIEIDIASKITPKHFCYRGGFRVKIYLNENFYDFQVIKEICKIFLKFYGNIDEISIKKIISNMKDFKSVESLVNKFEKYSTILEEVIFFKIIEPLIFEF